MLPNGSTLDIDSEKVSDYSDFSGTKYRPCASKENLYFMILDVSTI